MSAEAGRGRVFAVTGGIACGKSELGRLLAGLGVMVADADEMARRLMAPGTELEAAVIGHFGPGVRGADGSLDRARLAERIFGDASARADLNALVHPPVLAELARWRAGRRAAGGLAAALVPLLYEAGAEQGWDGVVCVAAGPATVRERLRRRGLGEAEAEARIAAQWPLEEKARRADRVVRNDGDLDSLAREARALVTWMEEKERG